jgi:hypothetical protein
MLVKRLDREKGEIYRKCIYLNDTMTSDSGKVRIVSK